MLRKLIARYFPFLGKYKRFLKAAWDSVSPMRLTYSQFGEDQIILEIIKRRSLQSGIYIDARANHPTDISNTYLLYRMGYRGVCIEPNQELTSLYKNFRQRDIILTCGVADKSGLLPFYISNTPVLSSFEKKLHQNGQIWKIAFIPLLTIDQVAHAFPDESILLLSIDVESLDFQVLRGAVETLKRTLCVCIEANEGEDQLKISAFLNALGLEERAKTACNIIFENSATL